MTTQTVPSITLPLLRGACPEQREIFEAEWPRGAEATLENVLRAVELGLSLDWGRKLFTPAARAEYDRQTATLWAEYYREWALLRDEYKRQGAPFWQALVEHKWQVALLRAEYQRQIAPVWLAAFLASHGGVE